MRSKKFSVVSLQLSVLIAGICLLPIARAQWVADCPNGQCDQLQYWNQQLSQPYPGQQLSPRAEPVGSDVIVRAIENGKFTGMASGTVIGHDGDASLVLTNAHVVRDASRFNVQVESRNLTATRVGVDEEEDLAILRVDERLRAVVLDDEPVRVGDSVQARGWDYATSFRVYGGPVLYTNDSGFAFQGGSVEGNSGGGIYRNGRFVGVLFGTSEYTRSSRATTGCSGMGPIRRLLARVRGRAAGNDLPMVPVDPPPEPPVTDQGLNTVPDPQPPAPTLVPDAWRTGVDNRIGALQEQVAGIDQRLRDQQMGEQQYVTSQEHARDLQTIEQSLAGTKEKLKEIVVPAATQWTAGKLTAAGASIGGPIGLGLALGGLALRHRRARNSNRRREVGEDRRFPA